MNYWHPGGKGDILYSFPAIKKLGGGKLWLPKLTYPPESRSLFYALRRLAAHQPYIDGVELAVRWEDVPEPKKNGLDFVKVFAREWSLSVIECHAKAFGLPLNPEETRALLDAPWLEAPDGPIEGSYVVFNVTSRYRAPFGRSWKNFRSELVGRQIFVGLKGEWEAFEQESGPIEWFPTRDLMEAAQIIKGSKALFCNASSCLVIAQGLGVPYFLEHCFTSNGAILGRSNETLLNARWG